MNTTVKPIVASTSLSFLLHGLVFAGLVLVYGQTVMQGEDIDRGIDIQLVSPVLVSDQQETEVPRRQQAPAEPLSEKPEHAVKRKPAEQSLTVHDGARSIAVAEPVPEVSERVATERAELPSENEQHQLPAEHSESFSYSAQATSASRQQTILQLLHRRISENKEYPYLARRQRREGISTVAFVLHPDGHIENPRLVASSRAASLDRAALSAVKHIEPFAAAREYLKRPEQFQVDIEFDLL